MRIPVLALTLSALAAPAWAGQAIDVVGTWRTEDGRARVRTERCGPDGQRLCGYVVWLREPSYEDGTPKLDKYNPDRSLRGRPALGLQLLRGLAPDADGRFAGQIYNADNGKSYDVSIWSETPGELSVRGCLFSYLCKTQGWSRTSDVAVGQLTGPTGSSSASRPGAAKAKPRTAVEPVAAPAE